MPSDRSGSDGLLLLVEDNDADYEAVTYLLEKSGVKIPVHRCVSGDEALAYFYQRGAWDQQWPRPSLVFLDLNLPGTDGRTVLATIKADERLKTIPVLVLSASPHQTDIDASYKAGANSYFLKPDSLSEFGDLIEVIKQYWLGKFLAMDGRAVALS